MNLLVKLPPREDTLINEFRELLLSVPPIERVWLFEMIAEITCKYCRKCGLEHRACMCDSVPLSPFQPKKFLEGY